MDVWRTCVVLHMTWQDGPLLHRPNTRGGVRAL